MSCIFEKTLPSEGDEICRNFISCNEAFKAAIAVASTDESLRILALNIIVQYDSFISTTKAQSEGIRNTIEYIEDVIRLQSKINAPPNDFIQHIERLKSKVREYRANAKGYKKNFEEIREHLIEDKDTLEGRREEINKQSNEVAEKYSKNRTLFKIGAGMLFTTAMICTGGIAGVIAYEAAAATSLIGIGTNAATALWKDKEIKAEERQKKLKNLSDEAVSLSMKLGNIIDGMVIYIVFWREIEDYLDHVDKKYDTMKRNGEADMYLIKTTALRWERLECGFRRYLDAICKFLDPQ